MSMRAVALRPLSPGARLVKAMMVASLAIASLVFPAVAQDGTGTVPSNAVARDNGGGWDCRIGYRVEDAACVAIDIPDNAYANGRSYGPGWACRRGYVEVSGTSCAAIPVPENAFLRSSGFDWQCRRGYREDRDACVAIAVPENAYLTNDPSSLGWVCERGFAAANDACVPIEVPANAHLDRSGNRWRCDRNFQHSDGECVLGR